MSKVQFYKCGEIPLEFHRVKIVQKVALLPISQRFEAIKQAGYNTYRMRNSDVFLDMLTDSGTNAMSDEQLAGMMRADDAYAGSRSFEKLEKAIFDIFGKKYVIPAHQGRAAENVIMRSFISKGDIVPMNYHFGSTANHIGLAGGSVVELLCDDAFDSASDNPFKGNVDISKLEYCIEQYGADRIPFIRMEASTNLIGGQPFSVANLREVRKIADSHSIKVLLDATLFAENAYLITQREKEFQGKSLADVFKTVSGLVDTIYFSARKLSCARGAVICTDNFNDKLKMDQVVSVFEGFVTYGGMSTKEIEAIAVGLYEALDEEYVSQSVSYIKYFVEEAVKMGIPMVTPPGVLGAHIDCKLFCPDIPTIQYPASSVAAAYYLCSGIRTMDGGSAGETSKNTPDFITDMELVRLAFPRKVFTLSQTIFALDRLHWLYDNRELIGGMCFDDVQGMDRCFRTPMKPLTDWPEKLIAKFEQDFGADAR